MNINVAYLDGHDAQGTVSFVPFRNAPDPDAEPVNLLYRYERRRHVCLSIMARAECPFLLTGRGIMTSWTVGVRIPSRRSSSSAGRYCV